MAINTRELVPPVLAIGAGSLLFAIAIKKKKPVLSRIIEAVIAGSATLFTISAALSKREEPPVV